MLEKPIPGCLTSKNEEKFLEDLIALGLSEESANF